MRGATIAIMALLLSACDQQPAQHAPTSNAPAAAVQSQAIPPPGTGPNARTPLAEPRGPIDPKSAEAAGQVVQHYGALIEQGRWTEANALWGDERAAYRFHTYAGARAREIHMEVGKPGNSEGAAGSIYVTVPVILYGELENGAKFRRSATVVLRRVNDVPGSTQAQRQWHIQQIDLGPDA